MTAENERGHTDEAASVEDAGLPQQVKDPLWTVEDVAEYLRLTPETVRAMARRGELPALKLGKVWRFSKVTLEQFLEEGLAAE